MISAVGFSLCGGDGDGFVELCWIFRGPILINCSFSPFKCGGRRDATATDRRLADARRPFACRHSPLLKSLDSFGDIVKNRLRGATTACYVLPRYVRAKGVDISLKSLKNS